MTARKISSLPLTVFKGGTAFNAVLRAFQRQFPHAAYVIPITDDGGSSREIWRVFGGPSIGDLRSTLTRLSDESTPEACAVKKLLEHRLPMGDGGQAMAEWHALLEGSHCLFANISSKYKELLRCFLCRFEAERLHRISCQFNMHNGSIGNFFFTGARMVLGSLETAIFMYSSVAQISPSTHVLPIIDSNDRLGIGAKLSNGEIIIGQHIISHPTADGRVEKRFYEPLESPIQELFYVDKFQNIIHPRPHQEVIRKISGSGGIIYGMGSIWTSIIPSLVLEGVGEAIVSLSGPKIALMNACYDRESEGMTGMDYIQRLTDSLNRFGTLHHPPSAYLTHLYIVEGCAIPIDEKQVEGLGISLCRIPADLDLQLSIQNKSHPTYCADELIAAIERVMCEGNE